MKHIQYLLTGLFAFILAIAIFAIIVILFYYFWMIISLILFGGVLLNALYDIGKGIHNY